MSIRVYDASAEFPVNLNISIWTISGGLPETQLFSQTFTPAEFVSGAAWPAQSGRNARRAASLFTCISAACPRDANLPHCCKRLFFLPFVLELRRLSINDRGALSDPLLRWHWAI